MPLGSARVTRTDPGCGYNLGRNCLPAIQALAIEAPFAHPEALRNESKVGHFGRRIKQVPINGLARVQCCRVRALAELPMGAHAGTSLFGHA